MFAATAAILPSLIATSRTALIRFLPSMTWPPLISRSKSVCAQAIPARDRANQTLVRVIVFSLKVFTVVKIIYRHVSVLYFRDMNRRIFLASAASASALSAAETRRIPDYRIVTKFKPAAQSGMPGPYPGRVVTVHSPKCIDEVTEKVDVPTVQAMIARGMTTLTGDKDPRDSWARFFNAQDFVGIKINCSGAPGAMSMPEVVAEITRNLMTVGVKPTNMVIHERGGGQILQAHYERFVPDGVRVESANTWLGYDPGVYVEANFFGEDDTRSYLLRMVTEQFTKIINVPNMKDHGASGVTGCLKNIAYGEFNNVARSHYKAQTETLSFIGTLANVEPLRSRTVLNIMDGLRGVWHAGPFSTGKALSFLSQADEIRHRPGCHRPLPD